MNQYKLLGINPKIIELAETVEKDNQEEFKKIENSCECNSLKVLNAFHECNVSESDFASTTGYGYNDKGRETKLRVP